MGRNAVLGSKRYQPIDARGRLSHAERAQFVLDNPEPLESTLSPEEIERIETIARENAEKLIASEDIVRYFRDAITRGIPLHEAWAKMGQTNACPLLNGLQRDGDPAGASEVRVKEAMKEFADSPVFVAYRSRGQRGEPRFDVQAKVIDLLWDFMITNLVNMALASSWAICFAILQNAGVLPAPLPTDAQLAAAENAKPAQDGRPVAHDDHGRPIVHNGVRYSKAMLEQLNSAQYAEVMGLVSETPNQRAGRESAERKRKANDYRTVKVHDTAYTQYELDQMSSEKYRQVLGLENDGGGKVGNR
jgi:hypothetical protein